MDGEGYGLPIYRRDPALDPIADVEFRVWFDGDSWVAAPVTSEGHRSLETARGSTPITALMVAEAKARKAAR